MSNEEENKRLKKEYQILTEEKKREQQYLSESENRVKSVRGKLEEIKK